MKLLKQIINLDFSKSDHYVLGYDILPATNWRIKIETYYQHLSSIPVTQYESNYSILNEGMYFYISLADSLVNEGTAFNYGSELTIEKFLSDNFYVLFTGSVFESKYKGSNKLEHNTIFNSNFVFNFLSGYEFKLNPNNFMTFDIRSVWGGGKRYTPVRRNNDGTLYYNNNNEWEYNWEKAFTRKADDYFRLDLRIGLKNNHEKYSQEWGLDLTNITFRKNIFNMYYDEDTDSYEKEYHASNAPFMMLYRINF
jgi:hypothetical protein